MAESGAIDASLAASTSPPPLALSSGTPLPLDAEGGLSLTPPPESHVGRLLGAPLPPNILLAADTDRLGSSTISTWP